MSKHLIPHLVGSGFTATVQSTRDEIAAMSPELARAEAAIRETTPAVETKLTTTGPSSEARVVEPPPPLAPPARDANEPASVVPSEPPEPSVERVQHWREVLGMDEPSPRRWGRPH